MYFNQLKQYIDMQDMTTTTMSTRENVDIVPSSTRALYAIQEGEVEKIA
jgi:hypothetical protein